MTDPLPESRAPGLQRVVRRRPAELFKAGASVTVVVAPAGFGKSTLVDEWMDASDEAAGPWVRVDCGDLSGSASMWIALVDAARGLGSPAAELRDLAAAPSEGVDRALVDGLVDRFWNIAGPYVLVFDDVHLLDASSSVALGRFVGAVASPVHRVVALSRSTPPWPTARWRSRRSVLVLSGADLVFEPRAVRQLFGRSFETRADEVVEISGGWPLALAALYRHLVADPVGGVDRAVAEMVGFVVDEVIAPLGTRAERLLCRLSLLDRPVPGSVAARVGGDAHAETLLGRLSALAPLLSRVGESGFELHPLLRTALRRRLAELEPGAEGGLHRLAAAAWLDEPATFDWSVAAMEHLLAAHAWPQALVLLRQLSGEPFRRSRNDLEVAWLEAIPGRYWEHDLDLAFWYAGAAALIGQGSKGYDRLARLPIASHPGGAVASKISRAHTTWWAVDPLEALKMLEDAEREIAELPGGVPVPRAPGFEDRAAYLCLARFSVGRACALLGDFAGVIAHMAGVLAREQPPVATMVVSAHGTVAWAYAMQGEVHQAAVSAGLAIDIADECGITEHLAAAPAHLARAVVSALTGQPTASGDLERARRAGRSVSARNFLRLCEATAATVGLPTSSDAPRVPASRETPALPFLSRLASPRHARDLAANGDVASARDLLRSVEPHELTLPAWIELSIGQVPLERLNMWMTSRPEPTCVRGEIVHRLALAATSTADDVMVEHCRQAADLAATGDLIGVFLDAPRQLLDRLATRPVDDPLIARACDAWLAAGREPALSPRELHLLAFLPGPDHAAELAERLGVSVATIKSHLASIYRKFGVATRAAAVERGRELGLLPTATH